jgi:hypothetical protein
MFKTLKRSRASNATLLVLLVLASYADEDGLCYPSLREISKRARVSRTTVVAAIEKLVQTGELARLTRGHSDWDRVKHRRREGGFQPTNYYQLMVVNPVNHLTASATDGEVVKVVNHPGGSIHEPKVVQSAETTHPFLNLSDLNSGAARREPSRWDEKLRELVHLTWQDQPTLGGLELVEHLRDWLQQLPAIDNEVTDEDLGAAIEFAAGQRQRAAAMRRPHQQRRRA